MSCSMPPRRCRRFSRPPPNRATAAQTSAPRKKLLVIGEEKGYRHEAIPHAMATIERLGRETGLWDTVIRTDTGAAHQEEARIQRQKPERFRRGPVLYRRHARNGRPAEGRLPLLRPRRRQGLHRRPQRHHHLHQVAGVRGDDRRLFRRASLGNVRCAHPGGRRRVSRHEAVGQSPSS